MERDIEKLLEEEKEHLRKHSDRCENCGHSNFFHDYHDEDGFLQECLIKNCKCGEFIWKNR